MAFDNSWKSVLIVIALFVSHTFCWSQTSNYIPNSGFEDFVKKPCFRISDDTTQIEDYVLEWITPTNGSSDIWIDDGQVACSANLRRVGIKAHNGTMCAGIFTSGISSTNVNDPKIFAEYREYLHVKLKRRLQKGKSYSVEFYALCLGSSSFATNNRGVVLTTTSVKNSTSHNVGVLNYSPQINFDLILSETKIWTKVSGCFVADDDYEYLTVGNFFRDNKTKVKALGTLPGSPAYYLIDDVVLEETQPCLPLAFLGRIQFCVMEVAYLSILISFYHSIPTGRMGHSKEA